ncbi:MAG: hypothetical protein AB7S70_05370 [Hyphomicrobium sp.]
MVVAVAAATPSGAGWLSRLAREAAEGGGAVSRLAKTGIHELDNAAAHIAALPKLPGGGTALAAHVTPEGHWKFANREGTVFTAATPEELARVGATLAPEAAPGGKLALYLSEDTVFAERASLKALPEDADLHLVVGDQAYRLRGRGDELAAEFRPNVVVSLTGQALFEEAVFRLARPLNRSNIRVLALEPGGLGRLSAAPRFDPATKAALVDQVDPSALPAALKGLRGQTAVLSGRIEQGTLTFRASGGAEQTVDVATLVKAAEDADVNLVLLETGAPHQPGGRNWLWQTISVSGLDEALGRATFADFLSALGGAGSELTVKATPSTLGRVTFQAVPSPAAASPITDVLGGWVNWSDWLGDITGHMVVKAAEIYARDEAGERELDSRILPGIPSMLQFAYLGSLVAGLIAWQVSSQWWTRIWPPEERSEYGGLLGYTSARVARALAYLFVFLPVAGIPALLWLGLLQLWNMVTLPIRALSWLWARLSPRRA